MILNSAVSVFAKIAKTLNFYLKVKLSTIVTIIIMAV